MTSREVNRVDRRTLGKIAAGLGLFAANTTLVHAQEDEGNFGGTFRAATTTPPATLDVMSNTTSAAREATWFVLETLVTYSENYELIGLLAEDWTISEDGLTITFNLRQGVPFHNGEVMTSADVIASMDRFFEITTRAGQFASMESYSAVDDHTVELTLTQPSLALLDAFALPYNYLAIMPASVITGKAAGDLETADIVGTGPYKLVEWQPDKLVRYERFEEYVPVEGERDGLGGRKVAYFDQIELVAVPETGSRLAGLETGEYDFAAGPAYTDWDMLQDNPDLTAYIMEDNQWTAILINHRNGFTSDLKFRQAVQAVADMESIAMAITSGRSDFFRLQPSMWFPTSPWFNESGAELYNQNDTEKAKSLLEESGYDGEEIVLVTNRNYDYQYKAILALDEQLKSKLGMNTKVEILDWPGQQARWSEADTWHFSTTAYVSQAIFAPDAFSSFYGGGGASEGGGYDNPEMNEAFASAVAAATPEDRGAAYAEVQRIFHEDVASLKIGDIASLTAIRSDIEGFEPWYNMTRFWSCWRA